MLYIKKMKGLPYFEIQAETSLFIFTILANYIYFTAKEMLFSYVYRSFYIFNSSILTDKVHSGRTLLRNNFNMLFPDPDE